MVTFISLCSWMNVAFDNIIANLATEEEVYRNVANIILNSFSYVNFKKELGINIKIQTIPNIIITPHIMFTFVILCSGMNVAIDNIKANPVP